MERNCLHCNKKFKTYPCRIKRGRDKYCSKQCSFIGRKTSEKRQCKICNKVFEAYQSKIQLGQGKYCSQDCYKIAKDKRTQKSCLSCSRNFLPFSYQVKRGYAKFCSRECFDQYRRTQIDHLNKGGLTLLVRQLRKTLKYIIWRKHCLQRDKYVCQSCHRKTNLNVDHIIPLAYLLQRYSIQTIKAALDCPKLWELPNGKTLCLDCHKITDTYGLNTVFYKEQRESVCPKTT